MTDHADARCACHDFNRATFLRRGVAQAGKGLPAIEAGMPTPAGTGLNRRSFMLASAGLLLSVYGAGRLLDPQAFEAGIASAASAANGRVLVSVYLQGGIDSMSVLAPGQRPPLRAVPHRRSASPKAPGRRSPRTRG